MRSTPLTINTEKAFASVPRFLIDGMLGRLARLLRFLGYDSVFQPEREKRELISLASEERRVFLTRDWNFTQRKWPFRVVFVSSENPEEQLRQIVTDLDLDPVSYRFSLCSLCNVPVVKTEKESVSSRIPRSVWEQQEVYWECPQCERIYWQGGHWKRMEQRFASLGMIHR